MAMSKSDFKKALREVVSLEFAHIPEDESSINYTFSERFNKKMEKLIKSQRKVYWGVINTATKRAAVIFIAILSLFTAAFSIKAIREPIVNFFIRIYETFTHYSFEGETTEVISKEYSITNLPEGFVKSEQTKSDISIITIYNNNSGDIIQLNQETTKGSGYTFDSEHLNAEIININDIEIHLIKTDGIKKAIWLHDGYFFEVTYIGNIEEEKFLSIIQSVK